MELGAIKDSQYMHATYTSAQPLLKCPVPDIKVWGISLKAYYIVNYNIGGEIPVFTHQK